MGRAVQRDLPLAVIGQSTRTPSASEHREWQEPSAMLENSSRITLKQKKHHKLKQLLSGWMQDKSVHCTDFDKQPTEIRWAFFSAGQNTKKKHPKP